MYYLLKQKQTLGKDGKTYTNLELVFYSGNALDKEMHEVFRVQVKPSFKMSSKAYSKYMLCLNESVSVED